jgi:hypothetical protein
MTEKVEISENSLAVLVSEAEMTLESIDDPEWHEYEKVSDAVEEAREAMY